jgi:hypothetical protein
MKSCEAIEAKLVADEKLQLSEQRHLDGCPACRRFAATVTGLERAGQDLARFGRTEPAEAAALGARVRAELEGPSGLQRFAFGAAAMAAGLLVVLALNWGPGSYQTQDASLFTLLDEVDTLTSPDRDSELLTGVFDLTYADSLYDDQDSAWELPGGYGALDDLLEERWN